MWSMKASICRVLVAVAMVMLLETRADKMDLARLVGLQLRSGWAKKTI